MYSKYVWIIFSVGKGSYKIGVLENVFNIFGRLKMVFY